MQPGIYTISTGCRPLDVLTDHPPPPRAPSTSDEENGAVISPFLTIFDQISETGKLLSFTQQKKNKPSLLLQLGSEFSGSDEVGKWIRRMRGREVRTVLGSSRNARHISDFRRALQKVYFTSAGFSRTSSSRQTLAQPSLYKIENLELSLVTELHTLRRKVSSNSLFFFSLVAGVLQMELGKLD